MFGDRLKELREDNKLTQYDLAEVLNLTQQTISLYESNKRQPDYETLVKVADYFSVTVDFLLERINEKPKSKNKFEPSNIELLCKGKTYAELSDDIAEKLNDPFLKKFLSPQILQKMAKGKHVPAIQEIGLLSVYASVSVDFFYRKNTEIDLIHARELYTQEKNKNVSLFKDKELNSFIFNPDNEKYLQFAKRLKDRGIDPDDILSYTLKNNI